MNEMGVTIQMPLRVYDGFVDQCNQDSREYAILKNGLVFRGPKEGLIKIECTLEDANKLLAHAIKLYPAAVADISRGITSAHCLRGSSTALCERLDRLVN
jgi:hypothetical protein